MKDRYRKDDRSLARNALNKINITRFISEEKVENYLLQTMLNRRLLRRIVTLPIAFRRGGSLARLIMLMNRISLRHESAALESEKILLALEDFFSLHNFFFFFVFNMRQKECTIEHFFFSKLRRSN